MPPDLNPDHAMIWRDAFEFVLSMPYTTSLDEFWQRVREEYFREGGGLKVEEEVLVEW